MSKVDTGLVRTDGARPPLQLAGRGVEQRVLADAFRAIALGHPSAVMVHGEAGVGKTRLVREACGAMGAEIQVLWGTSVNFGEASVPFAPVSGALQSWLAQVSAQERAEVLSGARELGAVLPALGGARSAELGLLLPLIDLVVNRIAGLRPTVVVIDDLQWADRTSLDVLAYLIAGFREQHLALVATCRDEHRGEGHPLHGWLADMRRMPSFTEIRLDRLDLAATEAQISGLLGRAVDIDLAAQVHERSAGNPYLTELLVGGLSGDELELPTTAPVVLREALLASWHGLSAAGRQATRVLAVAGRPTELTVLAAVAAEHGVEPALLSGCLTEARDHGVLRPDGDGRPWFRHPLLAEVLYDGMPPGEASKVHASYVRVLADLPGGHHARLAADLAIHNHRAGSVDDSYQWSIAAADQAAKLRATSEEAIHLERACSLWDDVSPNLRGSSAGHIDLLRRTSSVCGNAGRLDSAIALVERALVLVDREQEPRLASTLLIAWSDLRYARSAPGKVVVDELIEAVRLTEPFPDSPERGLAFAALASAEEWDSLHDEAGVHAEEAVRVARRSGSQRALAAALSTRAFVHLAEPDSESLTDAEEAERLARSCGSTEWLEDAATWRVHRLAALGRNDEATEVAIDAYEELLAAGSGWGYFVASLAADRLLCAGRWNDCRDLLRSALAARCSGIPAASIRLNAAQLATRCGRLLEARLHLDRAHEVISEDFQELRGAVMVTNAEFLLASGEPELALRSLHRQIGIPSAPSLASSNEDILPVFANAAAEAAQAARDAGDASGVERVIATLDDLVSRWPSEPFEALRPDVAGQAMSKALFVAEVARCKGTAGQAKLWQQAIETCHAAGAPWEEAISRYRCAEARLAAGSSASAVSDLLRKAHRCAVELGAQPLQQKVEAFARLARVNLREPVPLGSADRPAVLAGLTTREREILAFLVAGRSNGEIAQELVISVKTVSVHVTNILRKTGTASRVEVAALADRLGGHRGA